MRKRKKVKRPANERVPRRLATTVNEVWIMDFVSDNPSTGRRIKCLAVARCRSMPVWAGQSCLASEVSSVPQTAIEGIAVPTTS